MFNLLILHADMTCTPPKFRLLDPTKGQTTSPPHAFSTSVTWPCPSLQGQGDLREGERGGGPRVKGWPCHYARLTRQANTHYWHCQQKPSSRSDFSWARTVNDMCVAFLLMHCLFYIYGSFHSICTSSKFLIFFFWLIPTPMVITRWVIAIWGVRTTKKPQIWPYFGPRAHSEVSEGKFQNFEKKVQRAITGAFFNPDTKCHTISESSGQCGFNHVRPVAHRDN